MIETAEGKTKTDTKRVEFQPNSYFENLLKIRDEKPEVFKILSPSEKITLDYYIAAKERKPDLKKID